MKFTYAELCRLNTMIGIALMSGKIEFDETSQSIHKKVSEEICRSNKEPDKKAGQGGEKRCCLQERKI